MRLALILWLLTSPLMAAITQRQAPVQFTNTNYPAVLVFPTAPVAHDLLVVGCSGYSGATITAPAGWTQFVAQSGGYWQQNAFYHAVASGEANSYTVGNNNALHCVAYDLVGTAFYGPMDTIATAAPTSSGTSYTTPSATGTVVGDLPMTFLAVDDATCTAVASPYTGTFSPQNHPVCAATGNVTTDTTTAQNSTYTLSAASSEGFGAATVLIKPYSTTPIAPVASSGSGYSGILPNTIQFDGSGSSDPKQETLTYAWTFGDGATSTAMSPAHSYTAIGSYTATVTVTNTDGLTNAASTTVIIQVSPTVATLGLNGALNGFSPSPADLWHHDAINDPTDPLSSAALASLGANYIHPDFSSIAGGNYGIPYTVVDSTSQPLVPFVTNPASGAEPLLYFSDVTRYPIPLAAVIEALPADCETSVTNDNHLLLFDRATGLVYALWHTRRCTTDAVTWSADAAAVWDGKVSNQTRPWTYNSEDAGGTSVFSGLIRPDEVQAVLASSACVADSTKCYLPHAIRFTVANPQCWDSIAGDGQGAFLLPMIHSAGCAGDLKDNPTQGGVIYGDRLVLDPAYSVSGMDPASLVIVQTMKHFGLLMADVGSSLYISGVPSDYWNDGLLHTNVAGVPKSSFHLVKRGTIYAVDMYPTGTPPTINSFTASPASIVSGNCATLTGSISGLQNGTAYIDKAGFGSTATVCPTVTTNYTLTAQNRSLVGDDGLGDGTRPTMSTTLTVTPYVPTSGPQISITGTVTITGTVHP